MAAGGVSYLRWEPDFVSGVDLLRDSPVWAIQQKFGAQLEQ